MFISKILKKNKSLSHYRALYKDIAQHILDLPLEFRQIEPTIAYAPTNNLPPSDWLIDIAINSIRYAHGNLVHIPFPENPESAFFNIYPGEHYRLLKGIVNYLNPSLVVEIGTASGMGCVAISQGMENGYIHTYDICPWDSFDSHLKISQVNTKIFQHVVDLSTSNNFELQRTIFEDADIIFSDASKDGNFEYVFLNLLSKLEPKKNTLLIIDDIKFVNMIDLWASIKSPKLDLTSLGHWSGTGLVDISHGLQL